MTLDQLFIGLWCCRILLPQDGNLPTVRLTRVHCKTDSPRGVQVGASIFVINQMQVGGHENDSCIGMKIGMTLELHATIFDSVLIFYC